MYCKNCGATIKEEAKYCPKCGTKTIYEESVKTDNIALETGNINEPKSNKHHKKGIVILVISIIAVAVIALASFLIINSLISNNYINSNSTEKPAVIKNSYGEYYIGGTNTFLLNSDNSVSKVDVKSSSEEDNSNYHIMDVYRSVYDGESFFAQDVSVRNELYKYTFSDNDTLEKEVWIDEQTLNNSVVVTEKQGSFNSYSGNMRYWQLDGEYIYFIYLPSMDYFMEEQNIAYRLGKISKSGSSIEFIGNETASTYAVKDGWIYYYDNGYTYDNDYNRYSCDLSRAGIYKMKSNGSQKQLLLNNFETDENDIRIGRDLVYCDKINIVDDYIYFIDHSKNGKSRVSRMKTDGSEQEYVSDKGAYSYTVDSENDKLYYATGKFGMTQIEAKTIYEVSIGKKTEVELFKYGSLGQPEFSYYDNHLYFTNQDHYRPGTDASDPGVCGMRYDLNSKTMESLYGYIAHTNIYDENGFFEKRVTTSDYYWGEAKYY